MMMLIWVVQIERQVERPNQKGRQNENQIERPNQKGMQKGRQKRVGVNSKKSSKNHQY
jgi:hypothetical protein